MYISKLSTKSVKVEIVNVKVERNVKLKVTHFKCQGCDLFNVKEI